MSALIATVADVAPILLAAGFIGLCAWAATGILAEAAAERDARARAWLAQEAADDADWAVFDTVARWRRDQDTNRIAAEVRDAFLAQMHPSEPTPIHDDLALEQMRRQLDAPDAVTRLTGWSE